MIENEVESPALIHHEDEEEEKKSPVKHIPATTLQSAPGKKNAGAAAAEVHPEYQDTAGEKEGKLKRFFHAIYKKVCARDTATTVDEGDRLNKQPIQVSQKLKTSGG